MAVVKINAIEVPVGAGAELERRLAARHGSVGSALGFLGFELLRPVSGDDRYFRSALDNAHRLSTHCARKQDTPCTDAGHTGGERATRGG